ncbi:hypothetical protein [Flavobacterium sp.]
MTLPPYPSASLRTGQAGHVYGGSLFINQLLFTPIGLSATL